MSKQRHPVVHVSLDIGMSGCFSPPHLLGPKQLNLGRRHGFDDVKQGSLFLSIADILDVHRPVA